MDEGEIINGRESFGQLYLITRSLESCTCRKLIDRLEANQLTVLVSSKQDGRNGIENKVIGLSDIKEGGRK